MNYRFYCILVVIFLLVSCRKKEPQTGLPQEGEKGFVDHGVASPVSNHRGIVATVDGSGKNVVLVWLFDHRGSYALLMIDAETGNSEMFRVPFAPADAVYSSILSSDNKFYTFFNSYFLEFDPVRRDFTYYRIATPRAAMSFTEDDSGVIWAATYPNSGLISFNPKTKKLTDYGSKYAQSWAQYPRYLASDQAGWIYFGIGETASQIIAFNPATGKASPMLEEPERKRGIGYVYRDLDGKVYGKSLRNDTGGWYEFYEGNRRPAGAHTPRPKTIITESQALFHRDFQDGKKIKSLDLLTSKLVVEGTAGNQPREVSFTYNTEGALVMGVATAPDQTITGGTAFPMRFFSFNPRTGTFKNEAAYGQFNALARQGDRVYFGVYPQGALLEWNPGASWDASGGLKVNPLLLSASSLLIHRPHRIFAHPDGKTVVMSGTPDYGYTGGGLLFWNRAQKQPVLLSDTLVILDQSTMSMAALPDGNLLGGTTTAPGTGGLKKATQAELYLMDIATRRVTWRSPVLPGVQEYRDLFTVSNGRIFGIADGRTFFVFDPQQKKIVHQENVFARFGTTTGGQSPRIFVAGPEGEIYLLFGKGIVQVDPISFRTTMIAESPVPIHAGGDYLDGRIYFVSGSHLFSYGL